MRAKKKNIGGKIFLTLLVLAILGGGGYAAYMNKDYFKKDTAEDVALFEVISGVCAALSFDPIPTIWHMLLIASVPVINGWSFVALWRGDRRHRRAGVSGDADPRLRPEPLAVIEDRTLARSCRALECPRRRPVLPRGSA